MDFIKRVNTPSVQGCGHNRSVKNVARLMDDAVMLQGVSHRHAEIERRAGGRADIKGIS